MKERRTTCPGCSSTNLRGVYELDECPVVLNYRCSTEKEAVNLRRGSIALRECSECGLIFNSLFDAGATLYDSKYENTQTCSPAFRCHLTTVSNDLASRHEFVGKEVIEVGCGKGDFLRMICQRARVTGRGYDTTCELEGWTADPDVCFHRRYIEPEDVNSPVGLIVCRHVVEHVDEIGEFLRMLCQLSVNGGDAPVYIETPDWDWIAKHSVHWDIFYEHCNYFSKAALANIAADAGFEVVRHGNRFGDQYQAIELVPASLAGDRKIGAPSTSLLEVGPRLAASRESITHRLQTTAGDAPWAIWGAGAKGVCLANSISECRPEFVIDTNPMKQGCYVPGAGLEIVSPKDERLGEIDKAIVMNSNYLEEIQQFVAEHHLQLQLICI